MKDRGGIYQLRIEECQCGLRNTYKFRPGDTFRATWFGPCVKCKVPNAKHHDLGTYEPGGSDPATR